MTLALYGKSRARKGWLLLAAFLAIAVASISGGTYLNGGTARATTSAVYTSTSNGTVQDGNTKYDTKCDVYLKANNLANGTYYIRVTGPNGTPVLTPSPGYFMATVSGGQFVSYVNASSTTVNVPSHVIPLCAIGEYGDSPNHGDEYKAWASTSASFTENESKTDNFKVKNYPDLKATKTDNVGGSVTAPDGFSWSIKVENAGEGDAKFHENEVVFVDNLPAGPSYTLVAATGTTSHMTCSLNSNTITCKVDNNHDFTLGPGQYFTVGVSVASTSGLSGNYVNPKDDGKCIVDPSDKVDNESDETNNTCSDTVVVNSPQTLAQQVTFIKYICPDNAAVPSTSATPVTPNLGGCALATTAWTFDLFDYGNSNASLGTVTTLTDGSGSATITLTSPQLSAALGAGILVKEPTPLPTGFTEVALRCYNDNFQGGYDNQELIKLAQSGATGVYCLAYNVAPPNTGTVIVKKVVSGNQASGTDPFTGDLKLGSSVATGGHITDLTGNTPHQFNNQALGSYSFDETNPGAYTRLGYSLGSLNQAGAPVCGGVTSTSPVTGTLSANNTTVVLCVYNEKDASTFGGYCAAPTGAGITASGYQTDPNTYAYTMPSPMGNNAGGAIDHHWIQVTGTDYMVYDLGAGNLATAWKMYPSIDHGPVPAEGFESGLYGSNNPAGPWTAMTFVAGSTANTGPTSWISDDYVSSWTSAPYRYVAVHLGHPSALQNDGDSEIDAVCADQLVKRNVTVKKVIDNAPNDHTAFAINLDGALAGNATANGGPDATFQIDGGSHNVTEVLTGGYSFVSKDGTCGERESLTALESVGPRIRRKSSSRRAATTSSSAIPITKIS